MSARRFPRTRALLVPFIGLAWLGLPVHPASAFPATLDRTLEVTLPAAGIHPVLLPLPSNLVAVSVPADARGISLELRTPGGAWRPFEFDDDHAPDAIEQARLTARRFSEPIWVGTAEALELRTDRPGPIRLHLVNAKGDFQRGPRAVLSTIWRALTVPRAADAAVPDQPIITRAQWGADESWVDGPPGPAEELDAFFVHHTDSGNGYSRNDVPAMLRGIYRYHTKTRGWSDIGYNFLIDRFGRMYEGRAGSITEPMIGAHARGANEGSAGVSLIGNFSNVGPSSAMRTSLARLIAWKADLHHVPLTGKVKLPGGGSFQRISGHRDANSTACPGNKGYAILPWLRTAASGYGGAKLFKPRTNGDLLRPDGDGVAETWRLTAWGNRNLIWTLEIADRVGAIVHTQTMTGPRLETAGTSGLVWDGRNTLGTLVPSGRYTWTLRARDTAGSQARPASGSLRVITGHFSGTALADDAGAYLVDGGAARTIPLLTARTLYGRRGLIETGNDERSRYSSAPLNPVAPRQGALLRTETGELLVVASGSEVRAFSPTTLAATLGYKAKNAVPVTAADLVGVARGTPITDATRHPTGAFVRDGTTIYRIRATDRIRVTPFVVSAFGASFEVVTATADDLLLPVAAGTLAAPEGTIAWRDVAAPGTDSFWLLSGGQRRKIVDRDLFDAFGPWLTATSLATYDDIAAIPIGDPIR